ncbi:MAG: hypothetical protein NC548_52440, partial [Lachnospiraceae bacterium]|nr:hypothetical protein [Lachnospiraceae bacterium]
QTSINSWFLLVKVPGHFSKKVGKVGKKWAESVKIVRKNSSKSSQFCPLPTFSGQKPTFKNRI